MDKEFEKEAVLDDERHEAEYRAWCKEHGLDPEDASSMEAYG